MSQTRPKNITHSCCAISGRGSAEVAATNFLRLRGFVVQGRCTRAFDNAALEGGARVGTGLVALKDHFGNSAQKRISGTEFDGDQRW